ncbi:MAG: transporter [Bacteroidota bacterium]|nr:transporter [Bacteroidota bacterium]
MIKTARVIGVLLATLFYVNYSYSQGCSDAGFCSMGSLQSVDVADSAYRQHIKMTLGYGAGEDGVSIIQAIPELELSFFTGLVLQIKIPFVSSSGNLGDNNGIGDMAFSFTQQWTETSTSTFSVSAGMKIPTGSTDAGSDNLTSLPMPYQTGLGTTDLILGASWRYKTWNVSAGYQKVLNHDNQNTFLKPANPVDPRILSYFDSNNLERGDDALLRLEKQYKFRNLVVTPGVLAIFRLTEDKITDTTEKQVALNGSDGITLNITASATYILSNRFDLLLMAGAPAVVRDVRADGLTRSFVVNVGFRYNFNFSK